MERLAQVLHRHGKVTFEVIAPTVAGVVTAVILIGNLKKEKFFSSIRLLMLYQRPSADEHDELDVELLGADPKHWQTNVYAPSQSDTKPLWGVFGSVVDEIVFVIRDNCAYGPLPDRIIIMLDT